MNLKKYNVMLDEDNKIIKFKDGREFLLLPLPALEEKETLSDKIRDGCNWCNTTYKALEVVNVKEALKEFMKFLPHHDALTIHDKAKEIFGDELIK